MARGNAEQMVDDLLRKLARVPYPSEHVKPLLVSAILDAKLAAVATTTTILDENSLGAPRDPETLEEQPEKAHPAYRAQLDYFGALMAAREAVGR